MKYKYLFIFIIIPTLFFVFSPNVYAGCNANGNTWTPPSVSWKTVSSTQSFDFSQNYTISTPDGSGGYIRTPYTTTDSCVAQPNLRCNATGVGRTAYQDFDVCPQGWETSGSYQSPIDNVDLDSPSCGSWSGGGPTYTLSGSTDAASRAPTSVSSGINVSGGTCTASGGPCTVTISDNAGNTRSCPSPTPAACTVSISFSPSTGTTGYPNSTQEYCSGNNTTNVTYSCSGAWTGSGSLASPSGCDNQAKTFASAETCHLYADSATGGASCSSVTTFTPLTINCVGSWGVCSGGSQTFTITTPAANGGTACTPATSGTTRSCGTPASLGSWSACSGGSKSIYCTEATGGGSPTCAGLGYSAGTNTTSCGTAASWSGWGACSGGSKSGYCTEATGGGAPTCSGLGYSAGTNTTSCGTAASWSGWGACSGGSQSGYCTQATGGGAPTCSGLGYSAGTNTRSCGTAAYWNGWGACSGGNQSRTCTEATGGGAPTCAQLSGSSTQPCGTTAYCSATHYNCAPGTSVNNSSNLSTWTWGCNSTDGGVNAPSCSENKPAPTAWITASPASVAYNGQSTLTWGSSNATSCTATGPWSNSGTLSGSGLTNALTANTTFSFQCTGNGQTSAVASVTVGVGTLIGSCGSSNGGNFYSAPTSGWCNAGSYSGISGTGPWTWSCAGANGGGTASCSANKAVDCVGGWGACSNGSQTYSITTAAANGGLACTNTNGATQSCGTTGVCGASTNSCSTGSYAGDGGNSVSGVNTTYTWHCNGVSGGAQSSQCSTVVTMTGTLLPASSTCTIASGASSCTGASGVTLTWTTTYPISTSAVTNNDSATPASPTGNNSSQLFTLPYNTATSGVTTFYLYNNTNQLALATVTQVCTGSTTWDVVTGTCKPNACVNGANNPPTCNVCTAPQVYNGTSCVGPLSIAVSPTTYSVTLPSSTISATYTLTNGTSANTNCRLLDNGGSPLTSYAACTSPMSVTAPVAAGSYLYSIQASKASTGEVKTSNTFTVTVTATPTINLSATAPTPPLTATTGVGRTYTTTIQNIGSADTVDSFPYFFQTNNGTNGTGVTNTDQTSSTMGHLIAGGSGTATSPSINLSPTGTYSIRVCADKTSSAGGGVITETPAPAAENDNCSGWTDITVGSGCAPTQGNDCVSSPNSCGQITGKVQCDGTCLPPSNSFCPTQTCGNGIVEGTEQCDTGASNGVSCTSGVTCTTSCTSCGGPSCGACNVGTGTLHKGSHYKCIVPSGNGTSQVSNTRDWTWNCNYTSCFEIKIVPGFIEN